MCIFNNVRWAHYHAFVISFQNYYFKKSFTLCLQIIGEILRDIVGRKEERKKEARKNFQEIVKNDFVGSTHMHMCGAHMWDIQEGQPSLQVFFLFKLSSTIIQRKKSRKLHGKRKRKVTWKKFFCACTKNAQIGKSPS